MEIHTVLYGMEFGMHLCDKTSMSGPGMTKMAKRLTRVDKQTFYYIGVTFEGTLFFSNSSGIHFKHFK